MMQAGGAALTLENELGCSILARFARLGSFHQDNFFLLPDRSMQLDCDSAALPAECVNLARPNLFVILGLAGRQSLGKLQRFGTPIALSITLVKEVACEKVLVSGVYRLSDPHRLQCRDLAASSSYSCHRDDGDRCGWRPPDWCHRLSPTSPQERLESFLPRSSWRKLPGVFQASSCPSRLANPSL